MSMQGRACVQKLLLLLLLLQLHLSEWASGGCVVVR
jgi:hypothetical protein